MNEFCKGDRIQMPKSANPLWSCASGVIVRVTRTTGGIRLTVRWDEGGWKRKGYVYAERLGSSD